MNWKDVAIALMMVGVVLWLGWLVVNGQMSYMDEHPEVTSAGAPIFAVDSWMELVMVLVIATIIVSSVFHVFGEETPPTSANEGGLSPPHAKLRSERDER